MTKSGNRGVRRDSYSAWSVFVALVSLRLLNALSLRTFFQPDEFFQSLEPAWQVAFGEDQGAWITWEWKHHLRSSIHPFLFAAVYSSANFLAQTLRLSAATRADLLIVAPKVTQAFLAAVGDFYTWKLARLAYGRGSHEAWAALALTVVSPWQWFCSTRTLSNCLETTITVVALYFWPWEWIGNAGSATGGKRSTRAVSRAAAEQETNDAVPLKRLRQCLSLAALACILRPTNGLIWVSLASVAWLRGSWAQRKTLIREVLICGSAILAISTLSDRLFYGTWTFPPLKFLYFNIAQSLAVFYGKNDWHYYISQGYPLLLTTALPFAIPGLYRTLTQRSVFSDNAQASMQAQLGLICLIMPFTLSLISHKEVRFIYPLLPSMHVLTAPSLVAFFLPAVSQSSRSYMPRRLILLFLLLANLVVALYTTVYHASGTLSVLSYLRSQHLSHTPVLTTSNAHPGAGPTVGFLMPCHSTPWRSHLVDPDLRAWALTCDPPIGLSATQKETYLDEADQFYADPAQFLRSNMLGGTRHVPRQPSYTNPHYYPATSLTTAEFQFNSPHPWPDYLVFFAALEPTLNGILWSSTYRECHRTFNTAWHDDSRRKGDIIVWCLDPNEQAAWSGVKRDRDREAKERHFDHIIENIKRQATGQGARPASIWQRWTQPAPKPWSLAWPKSWSLSKFSWPAPSSSWSLERSWNWPWERRRRSVLGVQLPAWLDERLPDLSGLWKKKKYSRIEDREYWT
ncbi:putative glycosylphosphatidylinositol-alpha 1,2 mannosyltransferase [Aspergillus melleus]|uniref:putative glycosylphosphatidylinositol-alpha 1,2 mannosyltransferase n=1 Tax=Aspergillus melleus TaxID=138277 RepID=UPI001E8DDF99|nr:glycosylphosphatidylinositol anchor biosynthesis [Aspergillus melleus]KAH8428479.1 glycosylphosphatidylinositol anchor biosynthesis [Aspergillus melleus]